MKNRFKELLRKIKQLPILAQIVSWSKNTALPGFQGVPIYNVISFIYLEAIKDNLTTRANSISYSFFLSIFPAIIFMFSLIPLLPIDINLSQMIDNSLESIMPTTAHDYLMQIIRDITNTKRGGLLSIGFILALFFSSNGMLTLMTGFDKSGQEAFKDRSFIRKRMIALALTTILALVIIVSFVALIFGDLIIGYVSDLIDLPFSTEVLISITRIIIAVLVIYVSITVIYKYGPSFKVRAKFWNPGSILATLLSLLTSVLFAYFVNNFGRYNELYGSVGALIVLMIWLQINAFILLLGFELNAAIAVYKHIGLERLGLEEEEPEEKS